MPDGKTRGSAAEPDPGRSGRLFAQGGAGPQHDFGLLFGNKDLVTSWAVTVVGASGPVKTFSGDGKNLPSSLTWDGSSDDSTAIMSA